MASPAPVAARAARAFAAPRPHAGGERARKTRGRLGPRWRLAPPTTRAPALGHFRHRGRGVAAAAAEGGEDEGPPPAHRGYAPVPGFGEYYVPPPPPEPERSRARDGARVGPDGAPLPPPPPPPRAQSKLLQEPAQAGIWERPASGPTPTPTPTPAPVPGRSFGDDLRGLGVVASRDDVAGVTGVASSSVVPYDANTGDTFPSPLPNADPELLRLRATYRLLTKAFGVLRYLFPVTGGLACWVAAGASLGGVFASLVPQMVNVVNVLAFALAVVMGGSVCLGAFLIVALVGRFLRNALFGTFFSESLAASDAGRAPLEPYDYPTHPGLLAQARAQSEQETRYRAAQMALARQNELQYEEYQRRYESSRAAATAEPVYGPPRTPGASEGPVGVVTALNPNPRVGGSWDDSDAYSPDASFDGSGGSRDEEEEEKEAFAAKAPPKRRRVDLPIETLMGLGGETLTAVGSEWQTQRQREAASAGTAAGAAAAPGTGGDRRNDGAETGAGGAAPAAPTRRQQRERQPPPQQAQARAAPAPAPAPVMRGGKVDWDPDALMQDMGYGAPAPPPAPAAPAPAPPAKKNGGGWFGGFFGGGGDAKEAPAPAPAPAPPPPEPGVDPVLAMLGGGAARENPNAARAAAAAAKPPSGDYYLSPTQEQSKEQFEEMQRRRDEWNDRVQRAVKRKDEARDEEALDDGA